VIRTTGNGAPGTTDTYTITFTDTTTTTFQVYNGADGDGAGDMLASTYDPNLVNSDAFDMSNMIETTTAKVFTDIEQAKVGHISVTQAVNLDTMESDIVTKVDKVTGSSLVADTEISKLTGIAINANNYVHPAGTNPHGTTKTDVGLSLVDNISLQTHQNDTTNPHDVNKTDVGLSAVINVVQMAKSGGAFTGIATGNNNTSYTTSQLRNARIYADGATVPTLADGEIAFIYEV